jgi:hypothetical protein
VDGAYGLIGLGVVVAELSVEEEEEEGGSGERAAEGDKSQEKPKRTPGGAHRKPCPESDASLRRNRPWVAALAPISLGPAGNRLDPC